MAETLIACRTPAETRALAARLAALCRPGDCVLLAGDLGVGKTEFARGFIGACCTNPGEIASPTFSLLQEYDADDGARIAHFDLYRIESPGELVEIGLEEALLHSICLIEWPQVARPLWPAGAIHAQGEYGEQDGERRWRIRADAARIAALEG